MQLPFGDERLVKIPELLLENVTVPVGDFGVGEVSVTVAVQEAAWLTATLKGLHVTAVVVGASVTLTTGTLEAGLPE
jgi:hypothetical protein